MNEIPNYDSLLDDDDGYREWSETIEKQDQQIQDETVACTLCGKQTRMLGTQLCDPCWELEKRVRHSPELARKILDEMPDEKLQVIDLSQKSWPEVLTKLVGPFK